MSKPSLGIIGSGRLGTAIARQASAAGYVVRLANSRGPESLSLIVKVLLPGVIATTVDEAILQSDSIVLALPLNQYKSLPVQLFKGKIVIDAMNYWPPTEGEIPEFMNQEVTSSEYIEQYLPGARIVKTLNHVAYNELEQHSLPEASPGRRAIALVGNDADAKAKVEVLINDMGFDAVDLGMLSNGRRLQPDTPLFNTRLTAQEIRSSQG